MKCADEWGRFQLIGFVPIFHLADQTMSGPRLLRQAWFGSQSPCSQFAVAVFVKSRRLTGSSVGPLTAFLDSFLGPLLTWQTDQLTALETRLTDQPGLT